MQQATKLNLLTTGAAAKRLGVRTSAINYAIRHGLICYCYIERPRGYRMHLITPDALEAYRTNAPYRLARARKWRKQSKAG